MFNNRLNQHFVFGLQLSARTACLEGDKNKAARAWGTVMNYRWRFLWHHRGPISRTDPHNFRKVEQEEVNQGSYWLASETLLLENTGSANLPMFSIWDCFIKTPMGFWRNNKSCSEWTTAHIIQRRETHLIRLLFSCLSFHWWQSVTESADGAAVSEPNLRSVTWLCTLTGKQAKAAAQESAGRPAASCPPPTATLFFIPRDSSALLLPLLKGRGLWIKMKPL